MLATREPRRPAVLGGLMVLVTIALSIVAGELLLRVVFRDGGRRTLGGPGGHPFEHAFADPVALTRGPSASGPKAPGVTRVMVMGDSITWGLGVADWRETYAPRLLERLNEGGPRYDMAVYARPGKEMDSHASTIAAAVGDVQPDIVVCQWFHNDVEVSKTGRPAPLRAWRGWAGHDTLRAWSYLYFALDFALDASLTPSGRSYLQYLEEDFGDNTSGWLVFKETFHTWATYATGYASRTVLMLYPPTPATALTDLRRRVLELAGGQVLRIRPHNLRRRAGTIDPENGGTLRVDATATGEVARTPRVMLPRGQHSTMVRLRNDAPGHSGPLARLTVVRGPDSRQLAAIDVTAEELGVAQWQPVSLPFAIADNVALDVSVRIDVLQGPISVGAVEFPVTYRIEAFDVAPRLGAMNTATSVFDTHPNSDAHRVIADELAARIQRSPARQ